MNAPNCSASSINTTCATSYMLTAYQFPGWSYTWRETNGGGGNQILLNNGIPTNTLTVNPNQNIHSETHFYVEMGQNLYPPFNTCVSGVKAVNFDLEIVIALTNNILTVQPYNGTYIYSNYQWYLGGTAISGATSSSYIPTASGIYTVTASCACGSRTSNAITYNAPNVQCSNTAAIYSTCANTFNLNFAPASGYDVTWYECNSTWGSSSILNGGSPINTITVTPSSNGTQTFYYYYVCTDVFSYATCTSALINVIFKKDLPIIASSNTLPATLSANPSPNNTTVYSCLLYTSDAADE
mgnify:CR=1 FL=1